MTNLNTTCFTVQDGKIVEGTLADFTCYVEQTTRPHGVGPVYYATSRDVYAVIRADGSVYDTFANEELAEICCDVDEGETVEERTVWSLAKYVTWAGPERIIRDHASEEEARADAEETYVHEILNNSEMIIHLDRAGAERELADIQAE